jgi:hypothetical protein
VSKGAKHTPERLVHRRNGREPFDILAESVFEAMTPEEIAEEEAEAVDQARKGDTLSLINLLSDQPASPLRDYILDILEHIIKRVPKPRRHVVAARRTYFELAAFEGICERVGMSPTEAVGKTQDHFGLDDNKKVWRARKRHPFFRNPRNIELYIDVQRLSEEAQRRFDYLPPKIQAELSKLFIAEELADPNLPPQVRTELSKKLIAIMAEVGPVV